MIKQEKRFKTVLEAVGSRPAEDANQNATRHYSEMFSKELALWLRELVIAEKFGASVLQPEGKVDTIYGVGHRGKSLDIGVLDERKYLLANISIKTFNFKDRKTKNYIHNFTGRFYELLGEELDLRRSYLYATLVALIFLPEDSFFDSDPSSFAHAVRQFSKIARRYKEDSEMGFEHVFIGIHNSLGEVLLFDATQFPPRKGPPPGAALMSIQEVLNKMTDTVQRRRGLIAKQPLPKYEPFPFDDAF